MCVTSNETIIGCNKLVCLFEEFVSRPSLMFSRKDIYFISGVLMYVFALAKTYQTRVKVLDSDKRASLSQIDKKGLQHRPGSVEAS
jgi:hypothetical protein